MIGNCLLATTALFMAIAFYVMQNCAFLIPYRRLLYEEYGLTILTFAGVLFLNLFALLHLAARKLFLKDTGQKLAHIEKQLRTGSSISEELSRRLNE